MKAALIILDGWGIADHDRLDAITEAETPNFDSLKSEELYTTLGAAGEDVGLPPGQASNSEVGHLNIGAGRVVEQAYTRVNEAIESGELLENPAIEATFSSTKRNEGKLHFMGLVSDGGVHSDMQHLFALIEGATEYGIESVTHVFTDGRDAPPRAGIKHIQEFRDVVEEHDNGHAATVMGRYYAMDRNQNWDRTKRAYDAIVDRDADRVSSAVTTALQEAYQRGETDEFIEPTLIEDRPKIADGDSVFFFNFRPDRSRQLVKMLIDFEAEWEFETSPPALNLATLTEYDERFDVPVAFEPPVIDRTLGEILEEAGLTQFRTAESEKYAHVTYFFNGGRELEFENETRKIVPSPDVETYEQTPEMSAPAITDSAIETIEQENPDVLLLNYSNPDMVGHTGNFDATVAAVEVVDSCLGRLVKKCREKGTNIFITSDHGTADDMGTRENPDTAHTTSSVPLIYVLPDETATCNLPQTEGQIRDEGILADIAPTLLESLELDKPAVMTGKSLFKSGE